MDHPRDIPQVVAGIMNVCWLQEPEQRPSFVEILSVFEGKSCGFGLATPVPPLPGKPNGAIREQYKIERPRPPVPIRGIENNALPFENATNV